VDEGVFSGTIPWNHTTQVGAIRPDRVGALPPGPYRVVLEWDDEGRRETNETTILVTRRGWKAPVGPSTATPASVALAGAS
jgi:hypothetical protein